MTPTSTVKVLQKCLRPNTLEPHLKWTSQNFFPTPCFYIEIERHELGLKICTILWNIAPKTSYFAKPWQLRTTNDMFYPNVTNRETDKLKQTKYLKKSTFYDFRVNMGIRWSYQLQNFNFEALMSLIFIFFIFCSMKSVWVQNWSPGFTESNFLQYFNTKKW